MSRADAVRPVGGVRFVLLLFLGLLVAGAIAGGAAWIYFNPLYAATAILNVVVDAPLSFQESPALEEAARQRKMSSIAALLKSQMVLSDALMRSDIARLDLVASKEDPLEWLLDSLHVEFVDDSSILEVALYGRSEEMNEEIKLVDAIVESFMDSIILEQRLEAHALRDDLRAVTEDLRKDLVRKVADLRGLEKEAPESEAVELEVLRREVESDMQFWESTRRVALEQQLLQRLQERKERGGISVGSVKVVQKAFASER